MRNIPFGRPMIGDEEKKAVQQVLEGTILVHGPKAKEFEKSFADFTGAKFAVSLSSCTAGLHLSYFYLGIGSGDEVIVPSQSHTATVHAVEFTGAKPIFVDSEIKTGNIDIEQIEKKITEKSKAISVVHYLGMPVDMEKVMMIADKYKLFVVEDCALAIGSYFKNKHVGLYGDVGCFSFYPVKHITTGEGGMLITNNEKIATQISLQKAFGYDKNIGERTIPGYYDVNQLGYNYRMSEIHSAIGVEQMKKVSSFLKIRKENYDALTQSLQEIDEITLLDSTNGDFQSSYYCHSIILKEEIVSRRFEIVNFLKQNGIGTSIYYPKPIPHFTYYKKKYGFSDNSFPNASKISYSSIALPVGPHLNNDDMIYIINTIKKAINNFK
jgi:dTDP-4-amino-4,6-dideoxygalactose transaminase